MSRTKWLSRVYFYTIHATTHIPRYKFREAEFLSFMDVSLFAFFRADISDALRYLHNCLVRITEIVQLLASGHKSERRGSAHDVRLGMPKPWMAVLAVPAVKLPKGVTGCLPTARFTVLKHQQLYR